MDRAVLTKFMSMFPVTTILGPWQCGKTTSVQVLPLADIREPETTDDREYGGMNQTIVMIHGMFGESGWKIVAGNIYFRLNESKTVALTGGIAQIIGG
jgi:ABC-type nitrate/sulfonate/bicarbonate transport system ATPase subunit